MSDSASLTFGMFSALNRTRCESPLGFGHALSSWSLSDWITATVGELGEAANVAKKLNRIRDGVPGNGAETEAGLRASLRDEIADTFIYLDLLAQSQGFDLADAVVEKFNKTSYKLKCPIRC
jgi:NTP pyrophosphatase (non-canonical NTP hydrolase)